MFLLFTDIDCELNHFTVQILGKISKSHSGSLMEIQTKHLVIADFETGCVGSCRDITAKLVLFHCSVGSSESENVLLSQCVCCHFVLVVVPLSLWSSTMTPSLQSVTARGQTCSVHKLNLSHSAICEKRYWSLWWIFTNKSQTALLPALVAVSVCISAGRRTCREPRGAPVMRCFRKPELISLNLTLSEPQLNGSTPRSPGQSSDSRISEISPCTADGFLDGSERRQAPAASLSNLFHFNKLSLKLLMVRLIRECLL